MLNWYGKWVVLSRHGKWVVLSWTCGVGHVVGLDMVLKLVMLVGLELFYFIPCCILSSLNTMNILSCIICGYFSV